MKWLNRNITIRFELTTLFITFALVPAVFFTVNYYTTVNVFVRDKVTNYNREIIKQLTGQLESIMNQTRISMNQLTYYIVSSNIHDDMDYKSELDTLDLNRRTSEMLGVIKKSSPSIASIYIVTSYGETFSTSSNYDSVNLLSQSWLEDKKPRNTDDVLSFHRVGYATYDKDSEESLLVFSFAQEIANYGLHRGSIIVQVDVKYSDFAALINKVDLGEGSFILIIDDRNEIVHLPDMSYMSVEISKATYQNIELGKLNLGKEVQELNGMTFLTQNIGDTSWKIICAVPSKIAINQIKSQTMIVLIIFAMWLTFSIIFAVQISKNISDPISSIIKSMKAVGKGNFKISPVKARNHDLQLLLNNYASMVEQIDRLMKNLIEKEIQNTNSELKALQAQINPHFLYNTLEVIRGMARANNVYSIADISQSLALLFRYNINNSSNMVTVSEEIEHVKHYIKIHTYRYGDKFDVIYQIDESLLTCKVPHFIIQPVVENALFHGIELLTEKGIIILNVYKCSNEKDFCIEIIDNGNGIDSSYLQILASELDKGAELNAPASGKEYRIGIGLVNVNKRIKLNFGNEYGLKIESQYNFGTTVKIVLPIII